MKKIIFFSTSLLTLLAVGVCKGAAGPDERWYQAVPHDWQQRADLDLSNRQITAIPDNFDAPQLRFLDLNNNEITAIPGNFNLPQLRDLDLNKNEITVIPGNLNAPQLQGLYLAKNQIAAIPDTLQLNALLELDLRNNNVQEINPERLLEQFPRLIRINLSGNTYLKEEFIRDLRRQAHKAGRGKTLEIIAKHIDAGRNIKG